MISLISFYLNGSSLHFKLFTSEVPTGSNTDHNIKNCKVLREISNDRVFQEGSNK